MPILTFAEISYKKFPSLIVNNKLDGIDFALFDAIYAFRHKQPEWIFKPRDEKYEIVYLFLAIVNLSRHW